MIIRKNTQSQESRDVRFVRPLEIGVFSSFFSDARAVRPYF